MIAASLARKRALLFLFTSSLTLAGCASTKGLQASAALPDLGRINAGKTIADAAVSDAQPSARWWTAFGDAQLDTLISDALEAAPSMPLAQARIAQAEALVGTARADQRPQVDASGQATGEYFPDRYVYPEPWAGDVGTQAKVGADARYHLDFWGRHRQAVEAATARVAVAREEARDATLVLQTAVAMT